jgi:hypothetical protein
MRQVASIVITVLLVASLGMAQGTRTGTTGTRGKKSGSSSQNISAQLSQMQQSIDAQQQQIQQLMQQLQSRDQQIQQLQQQMNQVQSTANQAQEKADTAVSQSTQQKQDVVAVRSDVTDLKDSVTNTASAMQETQKAVNESPLALRIKGITLTPGGFLAAETVWRQRGLASDVNTPFNSIPLPGSSQSSLSEFFGSGRQSRISLLAEGKVKDTNLTGYYEQDFLSAGVTSNNNQSNSYSMRQRQVWGQAALHGWSFTGGQMWSLVTETRKGVDNRTEALPMTIDAQYHVGFSWARQYGFRVAKDFGDKVWLAFSVENPQTTFAAHGNTSNFLLGAPGTGGGLYNPTANYSFNSAPDIIAKAAFEPGWGHYEVFGVVSQFRDRVFPEGAAATPSAAGAFNDSRVGGGIGANARGSLFHKHLDVGAHFLGGDGVGRYGTSVLPDATVHPDGTLALVRAYQALGTLEWHSAKWDIYTNAGGEYAARTAYLNSAGKGVGYGSTLFNNSGCSTEIVPGSGNGFTPGALTNCTGDTRNIIQGTFGFWYRFYKGPKGTVQWGPQYSYVVRNTWSGAAGNEPHGIDNMFFTSFRYYLP